MEGWLIQSIIKNKKVEIFFQPIVSINRQKIFGVEALIRGICENGEYISPYTLFTEAKKDGLTLELDKLARKKALEKFKTLYEKDEHLILFLNFESSLITDDFSGNDFDFNDRAKSLGIPPSNIALEIKEDEIVSDAGLYKFCSLYRERGFNIAMDDFGVGSSSFDRLTIVKPDIIKVDISIIKDVHQNHTRKEILKAITNMSRNIGARVLAEGVEKEKEILECMKIGINTYQGYWFDRPQKDINLNLEEKILKTGKNFKTERVKEQLQKVKLHKRGEKLACKIEKNLKGSVSRLNHELLETDDMIEAIYVIDLDSAKQIGDTIILTGHRNLYEPTGHGEDHSFKEYYYLTKESKNDIYLTEKYVSYASGNMCRTFAKKAVLDGRETILCLDIID